MEIWHTAGGSPEDTRNQHLLPRQPRCLVLGYWQSRRHQASAPTARHATQYAASGSLMDTKNQNQGPGHMEIWNTARSSPKEDAKNLRQLRRKPSGSLQVVVTRTYTSQRHHAKVSRRSYLQVVATRTYTSQHHLAKLTRKCDPQLINITYATLFAANGCHKDQHQSAAPCQGNPKWFAANGCHKDLHQSAPPCQVNPEIWHAAVGRPRVTRRSNHSVEQKCTGRGATHGHPHCSRPGLVE